MTGGAQGEQEHRDKDGKLVKGEGTVAFTGLEREIMRLEVLAGDRSLSDYLETLAKKERAKQQESAFVFYSMFGNGLAESDE